MQNLVCLFIKTASSSCGRPLCFLTMITELESRGLDLAGPDIGHQDGDQQNHVGVPEKAAMRGQLQPPDFRHTERRLINQEAFESQGSRQTTSS